MERIYGYINSINVLSSLSLLLLWVNGLSGLDFLSGTIVNNYIALTAVYAPMVLVVLQALALIVFRLLRHPAEYYQRAAALFSFVNLLVYLLFLAYTKYL